tara:strand:- start:243 stop:1133 length:891 start_codon:yes stop_codon:yes gene_type:complete
MKIYDCFMYLDEDIVLDLRLNYLDQYVDKFVIVESKFTHSGEKRELNFDIRKFEKFKEKIIYLILDHEPNNIEKINKNDNDDETNSKLILNGMKRDFYQRNFLAEGLKEANENDFILISDLDEIPKLDQINFEIIKEKFIFFNQKMFYYKFNLCSQSINWTGTKGCKKKHLKSPQWLRNIKDKSYPFWRLDILFSKNKYTKILFINDGGWHFSYIKTPEEIEKKLKSYAHHREYDLSSLGLKQIKSKMSKKVSIYDLETDMRESKFEGGQKLVITKLNLLPSYIQNNEEKYKDWLE